jgi:hypothetical protein
MRKELDLIRELAYALSRERENDPISQTVYEALQDVTERYLNSGRMNDVDHAIVEEIRKVV